MYCLIIFVCHTRKYSFFYFINERISRNSKSDYDSGYFNTSAFNETYHSKDFKGTSKLYLTFSSLFYNISNFDTFLFSLNIDFDVISVPENKLES